MGQVHESSELPRGLAVESCNDVFSVARAALSVSGVHPATTVAGVLARSRRSSSMSLFIAGEQGRRARPRGWRLGWKEDWAGEEGWALGVGRLSRQQADNRALACPLRKQQQAAKSRPGRRAT